MAIGIEGDALHFRVVQAEGDEHGAPVAVGIAIPGTVAGISLGLILTRHHIVADAFLIAKLALCQRQNVLRPQAGQFHIGKTPFPGSCGFHIRMGVGITDQGVFVFLQGTCKGRFIGGFITGFLMDMRLSLFQITDQDLLARCFFHRTDQFLFFRSFRLFTNQHLHRRGFFPLAGQHRFGRRFRQAAYQIPDLLTAGFRVGMGLAFRFLTGIHPLVAAIPVGVAAGETVTVRTVDVSTFRGVTAFTVGMTSRRCVTAFAMGVTAFDDIAPIIVYMAALLRDGADQL